MDFGKLADVRHVDFSLPSTPAATFDCLELASPAPLQCFVGCPVWVNKAWEGKVYPHSALPRDYLNYYAQQFNSIELNATHYTLPDESTVDRWRQSVPAHFRFYPKILQELSHHNLQDYALLRTFCQRMQLLGDKMGGMFLQLPPHFKPASLKQLLAFCDEFPPEIPLAIEFRHPDWFKNFEKVARELEQRQISTVMTDVAGRRDVLHLRLTTASVLIRFVGNENPHSDYPRIDAWIQLLQQWVKMGLHSYYFFVHQPDNVSAPDLALYFIERWNQSHSQKITPPCWFVQPSLW